MAAKQVNLLAIVIFILIAIFFIRVVSPNYDTYWHLSIGRLIWQTKQVPTQDPFVYGPVDNHFIPNEWLAGLITYILVKNFGFSSLIILRVILALTALYFLYLSLKLVTKNQYLILSSIGLAGYTLAVRFFDRPENFSYLLLALVNYCCLYYFFEKRISLTFYLLPFIFLAWPNLHGFVPIGLSILIYYWLLSIFLRLTGQKARQNLKIFTLLTISSVIVSLVQYQKLFSFVLVKKFAGFGISEWMSLFERLTQTHGFDFFNQISLFIYFYLAISISFLAIFIYLQVKRKLKADTFLLSLFCLLILGSAVFRYRLIQVGILISLPIYLNVLKIFFADFKPNLLKHSQHIARLSLMIMVLILLSSTLSGHIVAYREEISLVTLSNFPHQLDQKPTGAAYRFWLTQPPKTAANFIKENLSIRRLFTANAWNSYLIWQLPNIQVFSDVLHEYRTKDDFDAERNLAYGQDDWQKLLSGYNIDTVINTQYFLFYPNNTPVYTLPNWKLVYLDSEDIVYARDDSVKSLPLDLSAIHPELERGLKFKPEDEKVAVDQLQNLLAFDPKNGFARQQLIAYWLDHDPAKAKAQAEQSRQLIPTDPLFSLYLAIYYDRTNNCPQARQFAQETRRKSFNHPVILKEIQRTIGNCINSRT